MLLVDTNVLVDVFEDDPVWADWSLRQMRAQARTHDLAINPVIYAELSLTFESVEALDKLIADMKLRFLELPRPSLFLAGRAPARRRHEIQRAGRFFHRSARRGTLLRHSHARCPPIPHVFSGRAIDRSGNAQTIMNGKHQERAHV